MQITISVKFRIVMQTAMHRQFSASTEANTVYGRDTPGTVITARVVGKVRPSIASLKVIRCRVSRAVWMIAPGNTRPRLINIQFIIKWRLPTTAKHPLQARGPRARGDIKFPRWRANCRAGTILRTRRPVRRSKASSNISIHITREASSVHRPLRQITICGIWSTWPAGIGYHFPHLLVHLHGHARRDNSCCSDN